MERTEASAACHLAADVAAEVTTMIEGIHRGVLSRVRSVLPFGRAGSLLMDAIELPAAAVYGGVRGSLLALGSTSATAASALMIEGPQPRLPAHTSPRGAIVLAGLNCAIGDQLAEKETVRPLAPQMAFRSAGRPLTPGQVLDQLEDAAADPDGPSGTVAVFVHGLGGTELQWTPLYEASLRAEGCAAVFVRYNSGLPIHANGAALLELLSGLFADPRADRLVQRMILVGHSMGGLVARSALGQSTDQPWLSRVSDQISLAAPHNGAAAEKIAAVALKGLHQLRETKAIADFGNKRAAGIKDLRHGALLPEHWGGRHADDVLCDTTHFVHLPSHVRHHVVIATLGKPGRAVGHVLGDGLVRTRSALGLDEEANRVTLLRLHETGHMQLLRDPRVTGLICDVFRSPPVAAA